MPRERARRFGPAGTWERVVSCGRVVSYGGVVLALASLLSIGNRAWGAGSAARAEQEPQAFGALFVEAINATDSATRLEVVRAAFAPGAIQERSEGSLIAQLERLAATWGPLEFHHAEVTTMRTGESVRHALHVFARSGKDGRWRDFQLELAPEPPHRLSRLLFVADVAEPVYLPNGEIRDRSTLEWLHGYVDRLEADEDLSGAILIAAGDSILFERYFGHADSARTAPCSRQTRFNLGSGNKMFTALSIALLVAEGRLGFETTLDRYFADHPDPDWARRATVGHLLSHTSGAAEYWTAETADELRTLSTMREIKDLIWRAGVDFAPGEGCRYSNSNYVLAGLIVEAVSGQDYHDFVRERVYAPCGLTDTDTFVMDGSVPHLAMPLTGEPGAWRPAAHGRRGSAAGGGFSTPRDVLRYSRALVRGEIVTPGMLTEMTRSHTDSIAACDLEAGFGFLLEKSAGGVRSFGHGGIARGVNFEYRYYPALDITLVVFSNQDNGAFDSLRETASRLITGDR